MTIIKRPRWAIPEREATDEAVFFGRRSFLGGLAAGGAMMAGLTRSGFADDAPAVAPAPEAVKRNEHYTLDRPLTAEKWATSYNNFYEFGFDKDIVAEASKLKTHPWAVKIDGLVEHPQTLDIDDIIKKMPIEERLYRHRCVEAWSMAVPWTGFPLKALVDLAAPLSTAKYIRFETFLDPKVAPEQNSFFYPWPYVEGLTLAEATNELAFMVTGIYGKPLPPQNGAPLRLATPWKYGFKSTKSIVKISFTADRPKSYWEISGPREYGFWANVNPEVPHPRWSQASERVLGTGERRPTLLYNGYGDEVAGLYAGMTNEKLFM